MHNFRHKIKEVILNSETMKSPPPSNTPRGSMCVHVFGGRGIFICGVCPRCRHSIFKDVTMIVPQPRIWPLFRGVSSTFSAIFTPILHKTGTNWPLKNTPISRIPSTLLLKHPYFRNFKYTFTESKTENCIQGPQGPEEKKHPFFQFRVQAKKHPFFRFRVQAHENNPFFKRTCFKKDPFLREIWNDHAYTKSIQSGNTGCLSREDFPR